MVSLFPQSKIEHLEELVRSSQEEAQRREDEYTADLSETKELLEELRHSVKVTLSLLYVNRLHVISLNIIETS
jgi:hypothetical protein